LQEKLRTLSSYSYGTEGGVENNTPNPWGMRLAMLRAGLMVGLMVAGVSAGAWNAGWISPFIGLLGVLAGGIGTLASAWGMSDWLAWRSIPKDVLERRIQEPLLQVAISLSRPLDLPLLAREQTWSPVERPWPATHAMGFPLPAGELAGLIAPLQLGEGSGLLDRAVWQDVPAPPPSQTLLEAGFKVGTSVAPASGWASIRTDMDGNRRQPHGKILLHLRHVEAIG
jgi:hypothetical protein